MSTEKWEEHPAILDGSIEERNGKFYALCRKCENRDEIPCDLSEIEDGDYEHYCGRSPWCCP